MAKSLEESLNSLKSAMAAPATMSLRTAAVEQPVTMAASDEVWEDDTSTGKYHKYLYYSDDVYSTVDDFKKVTISERQVNLTQEANSQVIPFIMNRFWDGIDMKDMAIRINFVNKEGLGAQSIPFNVSYSDTKVKFHWLVPAEATSVAGKLKMEVIAVGTTEAGEYKLRTRPNDEINILESLQGNGVIEPSQGWDYYIEQVNAEVVRAQNAATAAQISANSAQEALAGVDEKINAISDEITTQVTENVQQNLNDNYYTKTQVDEQIQSEGLSRFDSEYDEETGTLTFYNGEKTEENIMTSHEIGVTEAWKSNFKSEILLETVANDTALKEGIMAEVDQKIEAIDMTEELDQLKTEIADGYYNKEEIDANHYTKTEMDTKLENISLDGYATEAFVTEKIGAVDTKVGTNTTSISSINTAIQTINQTLDSIDKSPKTKYRATYGNVELDDGTVAENMFTLLKEENGVEEVQDRFQISGGSGGGSSTTLKIAYVEGYTSPLIATINDPVIIKYEFSGEDSAGDTNLDGVASWKLGNRVIATEDVEVGTCEFDITPYVTTGENKVVLTITHATGAVATKAWTIKVVDVRIDSTFKDTVYYTANQPVNFTFTPYGGVDKTVHFLLDGKEIDTKTSASSSAGLSDSYTIPAQSHGTHLFEIYMTATINNKTVESNHISKDIIWYDENATTPVISCVQQNFTARQYETTNISFTVFSPTTETPKVILRSTYVNEEGETVEEYNSEITMTSSTDTWAYKSDVIGVHTLTITCGETVKTLTATITELGITVTPITAGLVFDFNPVGYSNNDVNRLWTSGDIAMSVSENFDWINGGYQMDESGDQCFCIKAGTRATINYEMFGDNAKDKGKEFKLIFRTENVSNADTTFFSCVSDATGDGKYIGLEMKAQTANIYAKEDSLPLPYSEGDVIEFEFNITPADQVPAMVMGYEDGVSTRPLVYDSTHDFQQYQGYRVPITIGSDDCDVYIYRMKLYNTSLSDRDILNNFIADARSAEEMIDRYNRNQIYKEGKLDPDYLAEVCPQLRILKLEVPWFTNDKDDKVYNANIQSILECIYKGGDPIYDNWVAYDIVHAGQGTSSNNYGPAGRNLDFIIKPYKDYGNEPYILLSDGTRVNKVSLTRESVPINYMNLKVNIASSENANNAILAKRYNTYNPYNRPFVREDESIIPYIKDTMEFQNCVLFVKESDPDLSTHREFNDNEWHFYAIGNIGDSKKNDSNKLTDPDDRYECILEVMDNTLPLSTMPTGKVDEKGAPVYPIDPSEWREGNSAYDALHSDLFDEKAAKDKGEGATDDTYGWRYIWEDGTDEENAEVKAYVEQKWKDFYKFIVTSTNEEFKAHLGDWCVLDSVLYYYLFTLRYTMSDNHSKNSFYGYCKTGEVDSEGNPIRKWHLCFGYDFDTALGIDNYGRCAYRYGYEEIDYVDGTSDWVWNAPQHVLFLRIRELFDEELCALYLKLETLGCWSASSLINQFNEWQAQWPEELWRLDIQRKYIRTYTTSYIEGKAYPEFLVERANGRKKTQRAQFERSQEKYMASKFGGTVASADDIILRCSVPNTTLAVTPNFDVHLTPFSYVYLNVKYNTAPPIKIRAVPNQVYTIEYPGDLADIIEIYSASCLTSLGDLSPFYLINGTFANATKIRELTLGSDIEGYNNTNEMTLGLGSNELLNKLDIRNMSGLTASLDLSGLKNLEELYATGSNISGVIFADNGNIHTAELPAIGSLIMKNLNYLTDDGLQVSSYDSLTKLVAENSLLNLIDILNLSPKLYQVRLTGLDWDLENTDLLERLYGLAGVSNTDGNLDQSVLTGEVFVPTIRQQALYEYNESWTDLTIEYNSMIEQVTVTHINDNGEVLHVQYVDKGSKPYDPLAKGLIETPTKASTISTNYTFAGWDSELVEVFSDKIITATYSESLRSYTVKYESKGTVLQTTTAEYGSMVMYEGDIPTYTSEETAFRYYLFTGWDKSGLVDGDKVINAVYDDCLYADGYFSGKGLTDLRPVEIYALRQLEARGTLSVGNVLTIGEDMQITLGHDYNYDDVESVEIINEKTSFTGSNHIDTEITLFDEDRDFTLAIDYKFLTGTAVGSVIAECYLPSITSGFRLSYTNSKATMAWGSAFSALANINEREMVIIRHVKGEKNLYVYSSNLAGSAVSTIEIANNETTFGTAHLVLGAANPEVGFYENKAIGEINWCKLWYADLGDESCKKLAAWTHEELTLEMCGTRSYYLSDGSGKRCSFSVLATHLLDRTKTMSSSSKNTGGWASATLRTFLNTRLYAAIPDDWKQLIREVQIPSSVGGGSTTSASTGISNSACHIYIPSYVEVTPNLTSAPYINEGSTISYMTTDSTRVRAHANGEVNSYWLRSPNANYDSYFYTVQKSGQPSGFNNTSDIHGVLIGFSF